MKEKDPKDREVRGLEREIDQAIENLFVEKGVRKEKDTVSAVRVSADGPRKASEPGSKGGELKGLEREIDQAIENLFVESGTGQEEVPSASMNTAGIDRPKVTPIDAKGRGKTHPSSDQGSRAGRASISQETFTQEVDQPKGSLENLETHLLSLEWEISSDLIRKIVSELELLKEAYRSNHTVSQVVEVMGKVANSLADNEGNITPGSLRFLLEAKDGVKLLTDELKDKEDYKNLILSGILARYEAMQKEQQMALEAPPAAGGAKGLEGLARDLRSLSRQLQNEIRQLGSIAHKLQIRRGQPASPEDLEALLVESGGRVFAVEAETVVRSIPIPYRMVRTVWRDKHIRVRAVRFPLVNLFRLFRFQGTVEANDRAIVMVKKGGKTVALLVDRLIQKRRMTLNRFREERKLAYIRGVMPVGHGRSVYLLDVDRITREF